MSSLASIFNDVIGPVMRGPSSSHTAAGWRVANMAVQILSDELKSAFIEFDKDGQWATNYEEQGTVLGMNGGFLNIDMADDRMKNTDEIARDRDIKIDYAVSSYDNNHANSMQVTLHGRSGKAVRVLAASLGGGSFELQKVDGFAVSMRGDYHEVFVWSKTDISSELKSLCKQNCSINTSSLNEQFLTVIESRDAIGDNMLDRIKSIEEVAKASSVSPIMPIISGFESELPFTDIASLVAYSEQENMSLGELGLMYEQYRSGLSKEVLLDKMTTIIDIIEGSIKIGLAGTTHEDRILHQQSNMVSKAEKAGKILQGSIVNTIVENVAAIMESKSALEVVVANPTAGSCGTVGAAMAAVADEVKATKEDKIMAYYAAGLVGAYFAMGPGFSAEEHGCQVETGA